MTPHHRKAPKLLMWRTIQPKFCPKKPTVKVSGRNTVATRVRRSVTRLRRLSLMDEEICSAPAGGARRVSGGSRGGGGGGGAARELVGGGWRAGPGGPAGTP